MTNFEKIKSLSRDDFLKFITKCFDAFPCDLIKGECANRSCKEEYCSREMDKWLDKEDEGNVDEWIKDYSWDISDEINDNSDNNDIEFFDEMNKINLNEYLESLIPKDATNREVYLRNLLKLSNEDLSKLIFYCSVNACPDGMDDITKEYPNYKLFKMEFCPVGKYKCDYLSCRQNIEFWLEMHKDDKRTIEEYLKDQIKEDKKEMG